jgi:WD40 repeat protein
MVMVFTDLANSVGMKIEMGVPEYTKRVQIPHDELFNRILEGHAHAKIMEWRGDGFLVRFVSNADAVTACLRFQQEVRARGWGTASVQVRIGIHTGEVQEVHLGEKTILVGLAADLAARVMSLAPPGCILMTRPVYDDAHNFVRSHPPVPEGQNLPSLRWEEHGPYLLKGSREPVDIWQVGAEGSVTFDPPPNRETAQRYVKSDDRENWRPASGQQVPGRENWVLEAKIGEGGFGEVWRCKHAGYPDSRDRRVFKFCLERSRLNSLKLEAAVHRLLKGAYPDLQGIAEIPDWEFQQAPYFLELKYTQYGSLVDWDRDQGGIRQLSKETRIELVAQVAETLHAAHNVGIIHRDVKPANILIDTGNGREYQAILTDFGIGRTTDVERLRQRNITVEGLTSNLEGLPGRGSPAYMAPELYEGGTSTTRSDVYALGIVLYQMALGDLRRFPGLGWEEEILDELLREDIASCLRRDPGNRSLSAGELAEQLRQLDARRARRAAEAAERQMLLRQQERRKQRRRVAAWVIVLLIVFVLVVVPVAVTTYLARRQAESLLAASRRTVYNLTLAQVEQLWFRDPVQAKELLNDPNFCPENLHDFTRDYYLQICQTERYPRVENTNGHLAVAFSPDGKTLVSGGVDGMVRLWDVDKLSAKGPPRALLRAQGAVQSVSFSPNGETLVGGGDDGRVRLWNAKTGEVQRQFEGHRDAAPFIQILSVSTSPDGQTIATAGADSSVRLWSVQTGEEKSRLKGHIGGVNAVSFSMDGCTLASAGADGTLRIWNVKTGKEISEFRKRHTDAVNCVAFSPDRKTLASGDADGATRLWDVKTGEMLRELEVDMDAVNCVSFSHDGETLATGGADGTVRLWIVKTGEEHARLTGHSNAVNSLAFSPDRKTLTSGSVDGTVRLWVVATGEKKQLIEGQLDPNSYLVPKQEHIPLPGHTGAVRCVSFASDRKTLASVASDRTIRLWDVAEAKGRSVIRGHTGRIRTVSFSPDGKLLASGGDDRVIRLWDPVTGLELHQLKRHTEWIRCVSFSPDGKTLASGGDDGSVWLWDVDGGKEPRPREWQPDKAPGVAVFSVAFCPDSETLASGRADGVVDLWDVKTGKKRPQLKGHIGAL